MCTPTELLSLVGVCERAVVVWHGYGHGLPLCSPELVDVFCGAARGVASTAPGPYAVPADRPLDELLLFSDADSLGQLAADPATGTAKLVTFNCLAVSMLLVVCEHVVHPGLLTANLFKGAPGKEEELACLVRLVAQLNDVCFPCFATLLGVWDRRVGFTGGRYRANVVFSLAAFALLHCSKVPEWVVAFGISSGLLRKFHHALSMQRIQSPAWWPVAMLLWSTLSYATARLRAGRSKRWTLLLPAISMVMHFGSWGAALPWPLRRFPTHRHYTGPLRDLASLLPLAQPLGGFTHLYWYHACLPVLLPRGFPSELPFTHVVRCATPTRVRAFWMTLYPAALALHVLHPHLHQTSRRPYDCMGNGVRTGTKKCIQLVVDGAAVGGASHTLSTRNM